MSDNRHWVAYRVEDPSKPKPEGAVRIMCMSDTHSKHKTIPKKYIFPADIAVHAGDFTNIGKLEDVISFRDWYKRLPATYKILVAGNHDVTFDEHCISHRHYSDADKHSKNEIKCPEIIYAEEESVELMGIKFYCSPRSPYIWNWCFPSKFENKGSEWNGIDNSFDVVVTHSPPTGVLDFEVKECALGDPYLAYKIQQCKTPLHIFGHTHCCNGFYRHGPTLYVNCAVVDLYNKYNCPPIYIDMIKSDQKFEVPDHYFSQQELIEMSFYKNEAFN